MTNAGTKFPYVCKYYNSTCPKLETTAEFSDFPVNKYHIKGGKNQRSTKYIKVSFLGFLFTNLVFQLAF